MQEPIQLSTTFKNDQNELKNQISRSGASAITEGGFFSRTFHIIKTHLPTKTTEEAFYFFLKNMYLLASSCDGMEVKSRAKGDLYKGSGWYPCIPNP